MGIDDSDELTMKGAPSATGVVRRVAARYFLTLAAIIGLVVVDQVAIQPFVSRLSSFAPAINIAGRQRMLSQKLTKAALALQISSDEAQRRARIRELQETLDQWTRAHRTLREGSSELAVRKIRMDDIESEWRQLEPQFQEMRRAALAIIDSLNNSNHSQQKANTAAILAHEPAYLTSMDRIVKLMENEAATAVLRLRICAGTIAAGVVSLVVALGWFVIRPATRTIRCQVDELENQVAERTRSLSTALEKLQREVADREAAELKSQRLAAQLAHAARVTTLGHLAVGLAHELNQPLATIANYTEACDVELDRHPSAGWSDRLRKNLERTKNAALRAGQIVHRMRRFVSPDLPPAAHCEIEMLIREVVEFCQPEIDRAGARITLGLDDEHAVVSVDPIQIQQVLVNLIQNALHAVHLCPADDPRIAVRTSILTDCVQIDVVDSGPGLETPDSETIFAPFVTTKHGGLGVGLSICRSIVEEHGGIIWAENTGNRGAKVSFTLPRAFSIETNVGTGGISADCVCS